MSLLKTRKHNIFKKRHRYLFAALIIISFCSCFLFACTGRNEPETAQASAAQQLSESSEAEAFSVSGAGKEAVTKEEETTRPVSDVHELTRAEAVARSFGYDEGESIISTPPETDLAYSDGYFEYFTFTYAGEEFTALHEYDNWQIRDSYRIRNSKDMELICRALIDIYPVHGRDNESYRTPEDMAYEWIQHNIVCEMPEIDKNWLDRARNVDLDPDEQNMSLWEMYKANR